MRLIIGAKDNISVAQTNYATALLRKAMEVYPNSQDMNLDIQFSGVPFLGWSICLSTSINGNPLYHVAEGADSDEEFDVDSNLNLFAQ
jgi:hypothetical protein